jgi:orotate phosphoribosyltransferase
VQEFGCEVVHVVAIVDRLQGGAEAFGKLALPFSPLLTIRDFGIDPPETT